MSQKTGLELLESFVDVAPYMATLNTGDLVIGIVDREKYLYVTKAKSFDLQIKQGDPIKLGSGVDKAIKSGERQVTTVSKEVWGVAIKAVAIPIMDDAGNIVGGVALVSNLENETKMKEIIKQFTSSFEQVNSNVQDISAGAENLAKVGEKLTSITHQTMEDVKKTDDIIQMIREVADQTKLLGLNAAIEAARAGEQGRGFAVVAEEIRRLSEQSNNSAKQVKTILEQISNSMQAITNQTQETSAVSQEQSASNQEIAAAMEELLAQLESLNELAKYL